MADGRAFGARLLIAAAMAGALAGAAAVYVSGWQGGNLAETAASDDARCTDKQAAAKALGAAATGEVAAMQAADPPRSLASLAFAKPGGAATSIADFGGKTVLLNLWATWCAPCRAEMPALDALQKAKGGDRFEVAAVNVDTGDDLKPRRFLEETGVKALAAYRENTLTLFDDLKERGLALGLPVTLLIDPEGCLLAALNGPADWASADAARLIDAALAR